jgi:hypothetical protein
VRGDSVVSATVASTGKPYDPHFFRTIDGYFDFIQKAHDEHAARIDVTYDSAIGYPTSITYDGSVMIADDEVLYQISEVRRSP